MLKTIKMILVETILQVCDNSDAQLVRCIHLIGGSFRKKSRLGDLILVVIRKRKRTKNLIKREIQLAIIINTKINTQRENGLYLRFFKNAVFLLKEDLN